MVILTEQGPLAHTTAEAAMRRVPLLIALIDRRLQISKIKLSER